VSDRVASIFSEHVDVARKLDAIASGVEQAADLILRAFQSGGQLFSPATEGRRLTRSTSPRS
jgi:hypothetical protein